MKLPENIRINTLHLLIKNLERSVAFYTNVIGMELLIRDEQSASLGVGETPLLVLREDATAHQVKGTSGLYHFAILVPERDDLSYALRRIAETQSPVQGFADHGVSEAIYLADPDGNGIEIYRDLPRDAWPRDASGELKMVTDPLDVNGLLAAVDNAAPTNRILPPGTTIGHMHLHVRNIDEAVAFYRDALGFNLIQRYGPSAAFLAAGDYHHHIGVNTWAGIGAPPKPEDAVGLQEFTIHLPVGSDLASISENLRKSAIPFDEENKTLAVSDPSGNKLRFSIN
jgi:catechol 2,3-dioxygenase